MKKLIGVIIDTIDGEYQRNITEHLIRAATSRQVKLLFFAGSALERPDSDRLENRSIFGLANDRMLDGVIIVPSTMIHRFEETELVSILDNFGHGPVVSIGFSLEGAHAIHVDNERASRAVIEHMMGHYDLEDICYVSGPMKNVEAQERFNAWLKILEEHGKTYDSRRHYEGYFVTEDGPLAVDKFIETFGKVPKAIVAANDEMAIGIYKRLSQLGYHIPQDVGIAGFDNIERTSDFFPPITTYDQCLDSVSEKALDAIIALADKQMVIGEEVIDGELIVRESCGCMTLPSKASRQLVTAASSEVQDCTEEINRVEQVLRDHLKTGIEPLIKKDILPSDENQDKIPGYSLSLLEDLISDLRQVTDNAFGKCLNSLISYSVATEGKNTDLVDFYDQVERYILKVTDNNQLMVRIENMLYVVSNVINAGVRRREENYQYSFRRMYLMSRSVVREFNGVNSNEDIFDILSRSLPYYGISYCYMAFYKRPMNFVGYGQFIYPMMSDLVFSYENGHIDQKKSFVTRNMLPSKVIYNQEVDHLLFLSLDSRRTQYGFIAFSTDGIDYTIYETIRSHISEALKRSQIDMKRLEAERALNNVLRELELSNDLLRHQSIHDELTGLYNRRGFYTKAEQYYQRVFHKKEAFGLIFGDIDGLKKINDNYGHDEGDYAIKYVARTLKDVFGDRSIVGRMSGDEFTALVMNVKDPKLINESIVDMNQRLLDFNTSGDKPYEVSISLGYAPYDYGALHSIDELLLQADKNMYRVKDRKKR